jgi:hypothetical protein
MSDLFNTPKTTRMRDQFFGWSKQSDSVRVSGGDVTANGNNVVVGKVKKDKEPVRLFQPSQKVIYPYQVSIKDNDPLTLKVLRGRWQQGAAGDWFDTEDEEGLGGFAYLSITQDADRNVTDVTVTISTTAQPYVEYISASVIKSHVPLAEVVVEAGKNKVKQYRYGNFTLGLWQIDGEVMRWTETLIGTLPPQA